MAAQSELPSFRRPPLGEMVLALQFESLAQLDIRHVGLITERFQDQFPTFAVQPPLEPTLERFDRHHAVPTFSVQMRDVPLFPRMWLMDGKNVELVQIQPDRLMHNWRRVSDADEYPRYSQLRDAFARDWARLSDVLAELHLGVLQATQCEVSYVNHIEAGVPEGGYADPARVFTFLAPSVMHHGQADYEGVAFSSSGVAKSRGPDDEGILARFFIELGSGSIARKNQLVYQLNLTVRGAPATRDLSGVLQFFDFAHERIVRGFCELTTPEMHKSWERER